MIADDLAIDVKTAALLSSAYTFPYALVQPALGVTGDFFGKTRLMNLCLLVIALSALVCAVATSFSLLVAMRVAAGLVAGGIFPVAMALTGDLVPVDQRHVAIGRLLAVGLTGNLVGSSIAGVIGDLLGWRGVFAILGSFGLIVTIAAFFAFRGVVTAAHLPQPGSSSLRCMSHGCGRSPSTACLDSASTSCTVVSRSMSPNSRRRHAALPPRCIHPSSTLARPRGRWSTAMVLPMAGRSRAFSSAQRW